MTLALPSPFRSISQVRSSCALGVSSSDFWNTLGTAIYLFCIQPPNAASVGGTPANTNLSFTLDNQVVGNFSPMETITEFLPNQNVLSLDSLSDQLHQLVVTVGDDSVFLFSSLIYTNRSAGNPTPHTTE